jgi:hypothetical protein
VDSYEEVTQERLDSFIYPDTFAEEKLRLSYWRSLIREKTLSIANPVSSHIEDGRSNKVIVCGCVRNLEDRASNIREIIDHTRTILEKGSMSCDFVWIESDSTDNTASVLGEFSKVISLGSLADRVKDRTQRIAICRNRYLEHIQEYNHTRKQSEKYEYMIVIDPDENIRIPDNTPEILKRSVGLSKDGKYAGIFGNTDRYYDVWALRSKECDYDCWIKMKTTPGPRMETHKRFIGTHQIHIPQDSPPYEVDSAFNGLGIYWIPALTGMYYNGHQLIQVERAWVCET